MLIFVGVSSVFIILFALFYKAIKEDVLILMIPGIVSALSLYVFLAIDYKISIEQPYETKEETFELEVFDGRYVYVEDGYKGRIDKTVKYNGKEHDVSHEDFDETTGEPYVVVKTKTYKKNYWLVSNIDSVDKTIYLTEEAYEKMVKDILKFK